MDTGPPLEPPPSAKKGWLVKGAIGAVFVAVVVLVLFWSGAWELFSDRERVQGLVDAAGPLALAAYVSLLAFQAVLAPLPAPAVAVAGGFVFGAFEGFLLTWFGCLLGGAACFGLSRAFGRGFVQRNEHARRLDPYVEEHGAFLIFVLRLIPLVSFDAISYAAGMSSIPFWKFLLATAVGMAPGTFTFVYLGGASPGPTTYTVLGGLAALAVGAYAYSRRKFRRKRVV